MQTKNRTHKKHKEHDGEGMSEFRGEREYTKIRNSGQLAPVGRRPLIRKNKLKLILLCRQIPIKRDFQFWYETQTINAIISF